MVPQRRLLGAVRRAVATDHVGRGVPQQVLNVELPRIVLDRPGREGVPEAVSMHLFHAGAAPETAQHLLEAVRLQSDAWPQDSEVARCDEEGARDRAPMFEVVVERLAADEANGTTRCLLPLPWRTRRRRASRSRSATDSWTNFEQRRPVSSKQSTIAPSLAPIAVVWSIADRSPQTHVRGMDAR
jgi:hypothetical protein